MTETPGISCGYWKARNTPALARRSVGQSVMSSPWKWIDPPVTSYSGLPSSVEASVLLPEPFGPMMAWTSPALTVSDSPLRISGASSVLPLATSAGRACRSEIRNSSVTRPVYFPYGDSGNPPGPLCRCLRSPSGGRTTAQGVDGSNEARSSRRATSLVSSVRGCTRQMRMHGSPCQVVGTIRQVPSWARSRLHTR